MEHSQASKTLDYARTAKLLCLIFAVSLIATGFMIETPHGILSGLLRIVSSRAVLKSDYFSLASPGAALVNSGIVMLMSMALTVLIKVPFDSKLIAALFLMPGFALFGKNPVNILPFFLGVYLYSRFMREPMKKNVAGALYSTTLAPIVSELMVTGRMGPVGNVVMAVAVGVFIGFIVVPLATHLIQFHWGYNLFNYGFTCGLIAFLFYCAARATQMNIPRGEHWYTGTDTPLMLFIIVACLILMLAGACISKKRLKAYLKLILSYGRLSPTDELGIGVTMFGMGVVGLFMLGYILLIGGDISGPVMGGIFTAMGFAAVGVHPLNLAPIMLGIWLTSYPRVTAHATAHTIQMAIFFGATALAPIAGEFGPLVGILAGCMHFILVYTTGDGTGGYNLYNNGFAAGIVAAVLVTLLHAFLPRFSLVRQRQIMRILTLRLGTGRKKADQLDESAGQEAKMV